MGGYGNMDDNEMRRPNGTYYGLTVAPMTPRPAPDPSGGTTAATPAIWTRR
jgi:hypothetical protein